MTSKLSMVPVADEAVRYGSDKKQVFQALNKEVYARDQILNLACISAVINVYTAGTGMVFLGPGKPSLRIYIKVSYSVPFALHLC